MAMVPYEDTVQLTPYEEGLQRLARRVEALEADSGAWFGEEQAAASRRHRHRNSRGAAAARP